MPVLPSRLLSASRLLLPTLLLLLAAPAAAQLEPPAPLGEVDPDASAAQAPEPAPEQEEEEAPPQRVRRRPARVPAAAAASAETPEPARARPLPPGVDPSRPPLPPVVAPRVTGADLQAAWKRWRAAHESGDSRAAEATWRELLTLKEDVGATDLDAFSASLVRAAAARRAAGDAGGAVLLAEAAVALSPGLPAVRLALAEAYLQRSPGELGRYLSEVRRALASLFEDPRYRRPALADAGAAALFALLATAATVVGVLFLRRARYLLHDFHHLFPRLAARWQTGTLALLLLALPVVFHAGVVPALLVLFAAVVFYLTTAERLVGAALLALVGLGPLVAGQLAEHTAFAGTPAEDAYLLERGGLSADGAAERVRARHAASAASFAELFALGRFEARRGLLEEARAHYGAAAALRSGDARLLTNLGNALVASGDEDGAAQMYVHATELEPTLAAAHYNLALLHRRRAQVVKGEAAGRELDRANTALIQAQALEPALLQREEARPGPQGLLMSRALLSPPLAPGELSALQRAPGAGAQVEAQLALQLLGRAGGGAAASAYPAALALLALGLSALRGPLRASRACERCGRPVCRRCDRELGLGSPLCQQCVNVYARRGVVAPRARVLKQLEVERYQVRAARASYLLGILVGGAGHVFAGLPLRGALYAYAFLFALFGLLARHGVLRAPYGDLPLTLKLVPVLAVLLTLYVFSLRGLLRRQSN